MESDYSLGFDESFTSCDNWNTQRTFSIPKRLFIWELKGTHINSQIVALKAQAPWCHHQTVGGWQLQTPWDTRGVTPWLEGSPKASQRGGAQARSSCLGSLERPEWNVWAGGAIRAKVNKCGELEDTEEQRKVHPPQSLECSRKRGAHTGPRQSIWTHFRESGQTASSVWGQKRTWLIVWVLAGPNFGSRKFCKPQGRPESSLNMVRREVGQRGLGTFLNSPSCTGSACMHWNEGASGSCKPDTTWIFLFRPLFQNVCRGASKSPKTHWHFRVGKPILVPTFLDFLTFHRLLPLHLFPSAFSSR